jgi:hypothetical protein
MKAGLVALAALVTNSAVRKTQTTVQRTEEDWRETA